MPYPGIAEGRQADEAAIQADPSFTARFSRFPGRTGAWWVSTKAFAVLTRRGAVRLVSMPFEGVIRQSRALAYRLPRYDAMSERAEEARPPPRSPRSACRSGGNFHGEAARLAEPGVGSLRDLGRHGDLGRLGRC